MNELNDFQKLEELAEKHIDGSLSSAEAQELESLVTGDEGMAKHYAEFMRVHAILSMASDRLPVAPLITDANTTGPARPSNRGGLGNRNILLWLPVSVAASFLLAFILFRVPEPSVDDGAAGSGSIVPATYRPFALIESTDFAEWGNCTIPTAVGQKVAQGKLELKGGLATLSFESGARLTLEAPAKLELIDAMSVRLSAGSVVSEMPASAHGFKIQTPTATAIDYGTQFITRVDEKGETFLQVLEGEVALIHKKSKQNKRVKTGQGVVTSDLGITRREFSDGELVNTVEQPDALKSETVTITTAQGTGRDGTTVKHNLDHHYYPAMIMIKHCKSGYYRKGYAGFDLSVANQEQTGKRIKEAKLVLNFIHSGHGIAALGRRAEFSVYGVTDDQLDDWPQGRIEWQKAPANVIGERAELSAVQLDKLVKVGTMTIPRGKLTGTREIAGPELTSFLRDDKNRYATFLIVCHTMTQHSSIVYAIAGKRHPYEAPPTLHLTYE